MYQPNTIPLIPAIRIRCISRKECTTDNPNTAHKYKRKKKKDAVSCTTQYSLYRSLL